jgi:hypothetical protein
MNKYIFLLNVMSVSTVYADNFIPPRVYIHPPEPLENSKRLSSFPYISGDSFRLLASFFVDELQIPIDPLDIKDGDIIFVKSQLINYFFNTLHPKIDAQYILITHNDDNHSPDAFTHMLNDEKLIAWFAQNPDIHFHPKFFPIPIGLSNQYWPNGNTKILDELIPQISGQKKHLLYLNHSNQTNPGERQRVFQAFKDKPFCYVSGNKTWPQYLTELSHSKFVLSPHGNGLDCCRTWEALYMGCIPIVKTSTLDSLYEGLPVLIVNDWNIITEEFLIEQYETMKQKKYCLERRYVGYWIDKIKEIQKKFKERKSC